MFCCTATNGYGVWWNTLFGAAFLTLVGWGLYSAYRNRNAPARDSLTVPCKGCGALLRDEWNNCPKCGETR